MESQPQMPSKDITYLLSASKQCGYDIRQWIRYLRKYVKDGKPTLSPQDVSYLLESQELTMYQSVVLERGMTVGTPTFEYLKSLNEPASTPMLDQVRMELRRGQRE